jgi:hypothetical protein
MLKLKIYISSNSKNIVKENSRFKNIPFVETKFSKLINYLTDICVEMAKVAANRWGTTNSKPPGPIWGGFRV